MHLILEIYIENNVNIHNLKEKLTYLHEYGYYDQSIGAFSSFCVVCVQLMIVVDQLNLESESERLLLIY